MTKRIIYEGRVFTVELDRIRMPRGRELNAEIIRHPGSVVIVPVTGAGAIVLVQQYRPAIGRSAWELPAGSLKADMARARRKEHEADQVRAGFQRDFKRFRRLQAANFH